MAVPILQAVARGDDPAAEASLDGLVAIWAQWALNAPDVGIQTQQVLSELEGRTASTSRVAACQVHESTGRSAGTSSLMRTVPLVLAYLHGDDGEEERLASAARAVSDLTQYEPDAGDACVLWCVAIRHTVLDGELNVLRRLDLLEPAARRAWTERLVAAEHAEPVDFTATNGWVVSALQAAHAAVRRSTSLEDALVRAVRSGNDTDAVAAIAGSLAGALHRSAALPKEWRAVLHGWPGLRADDLGALPEEAERACAWPDQKLRRLTSETAMETASGGGPGFVCLAIVMKCC